MKDSNDSGSLAVSAGLAETAVTLLGRMMIAAVELAMPALATAKDTS